MVFTIHLHPALLASEISDSGDIFLRLKYIVIQEIKWSSIPQNESTHSLMLILRRNSLPPGNYRLV